MKRKPAQYLVPARVTTIREPRNIFRVEATRDPPRELEVSLYQDRQPLGLDDPAIDLVLDGVRVKVTLRHLKKALRTLLPPSD